MATARTQRFFALLFLSCCLTAALAQKVSLRPQKPPGPDLAYKRWLDQDVRYIITDQEHTDFDKLTTDQQRDKFVEEFWERRNPSPGSRENNFKQEHYRRLAYTNEHFAAGVAGFQTDRGRIYILYGPPDEREQHPGSGGVKLPASTPDSIRFPSDVWRYHFINGLGRDVVFVFIDYCRCGKYGLQEDPPKKRIPSTRNGQLTPVKAAVLNH
ncbi:MAG TPA: GWxTD domain-containing protein [Candidatus Sulfotelmatobacter sp.]|nr:GWxTD domain-containing protein [Candidatus Sulfotelmatobacter sp.]